MVQSIPGHPIHQHTCNLLHSRVANKEDAYKGRRTIALDLGGLAIVGLTDFMYDDVLAGRKR